MTTDVPQGWKRVIDEDFLLDCAEGAFKDVYGPRKIGFYPGPNETSYAAYGTASGGTAGYKDTSARGTYTGKFISVANGICSQRLWQDTAAGKIWVSAIIPFANISGTAKWGDSPGLIIEEHSRFTMDAGFKAAHLLWPVSNTSNPDGELDWPEFDGGTVKGFIHHQNPNVNGIQTVITPSPAIDQAQWHTYRTEWMPANYVKYYCDGVLIGSMTGSKVPANWMHIVLQNETSLLKTNNVLNPIPAGAKGLVETKWIRVMTPV